MPPEIVDWLTGLARALGDETKLRALFAEDSHWRDLLALTGTIGTVSGQGRLVSSLASHS